MADSDDDAAKDIDFKNMWSQRWRQFIIITGDMC